MRSMSCYFLVRTRTNDFLHPPVSETSREARDGGGLPPVLETACPQAVVRKRRFLSPARGRAGSSDQLPGFFGAALGFTGTSLGATSYSGFATPISQRSNQPTRCCNRSIRCQGWPARDSSCVSFGNLIITVGI